LGNNIAIIIIKIIEYLEINKSRKKTPPTLHQNNIQNILLAEIEKISWPKLGFETSPLTVFFQTEIQK